MYLRNSHVIIDNHWSKAWFSRNHMLETKPVEKSSIRNLGILYYCWWSDSPNISIVLMARKVPAEMDKNIA